jgi:hypothetical protein
MRPRTPPSQSPQAAAGAAMRIPTAESAWLRSGIPSRGNGERLASTSVIAWMHRRAFAERSLADAVDHLDLLGQLHLVQHHVGALVRRETVTPRMLHTLLRGRPCAECRTCEHCGEATCNGWGEYGRFIVRVLELFETRR